jgi:glycosyltransferase involved in cell wall biosynthesis
LFYRVKLLLEIFKEEFFRLKYSLIIPCYNEAVRINLSAFADFIEHNSQTDFIFVNDGSKDATGQVLTDFQAKFPERVQALNLPKNSGKAEAVRRGMLAVNIAQYDYVGFWDADLATPLTELLRMADILQNKPQLYCLLASRVKLLGYKIIRKSLRHYLGRVFATLASWFLKLPVYDTQCGAKLFKAELVPVLFAEKFQTRWIFDVEILLRFKRWFGREIKDGKLEEYINEMPLLCWQDAAGSKVKPRHFFLALVDFLRLLWRA